MLKKTVKLSGILFLIAVVTALLLGFTNELTKGTIEESQKKEKIAAMNQVIPAEKHLPIEEKPDDYEIYAAYNGDTLVGYAVSLSEYGYGGEIAITVGVTTDNKVSGVKITSMSETPGLGENAKKPSFTNGFKGLSSSEVALTSGGGKVEALSGATVTSKAVTAGVRRALDLAAQADLGGVQK